MNITRDVIIKEFLEKNLSPTVDADDWKQRVTELYDLAYHAKTLKVHLILENSQELEQVHREGLRYIGKQWVILK